MSYMDDIKISNKRQEREVGRDIIGMLFSSDMMMSIRADETVGVLTTWKNVEEYLTKNIDEDAARPVYDMVTSYGSEMEEMGFKIGFHLATKLFMEGLNGKIL